MGAKASALRAIGIGALVVAAFAPTPADAQPLGGFRWQLQPYCNVVTLAVTQNGGVFEIDGTDDQCGAGFFNPDGSIGFGLAIVIAPSGTAVHVDASISLSTLGGTWHDSVGGSGPFVFTPGAGIGGSPRPAPTNSIAPGTIGALAINPEQVQMRVTGGCSGTQAIQNIRESGSVDCAPAAGDVSGVTAGPGLAGGGTSGTISLSLRQTSNGAFNLTSDNSHGFVSSGFDAASNPVAESGPGTRLLWHPARSAFRAGRVSGTQWDLANIGFGSVAMGLNTIAKGDAAFAMGTRANAEGTGSVALGSDVSASTNGTFLFGDRSTEDDLLTFVPARRPAW